MSDFYGPQARESWSFLGSFPRNPPGRLRGLPNVDPKSLLETSLDYSKLSLSN